MAFTATYLKSLNSTYGTHRPLGVKSFPKTNSIKSKAFQKPAFHLQVEFKYEEALTHRMVNEKCFGIPKMLMILADEGKGATILACHHKSALTKSYVVSSKSNWFYKSLGYYAKKDNFCHLHKLFAQCYNFLWKVNAFTRIKDIDTILKSDNVDDANYPS
jgi:hypothetical protein